MRKIAELITALAVVFTACTEHDGLSYVDPLIGTEGDGSEYGGLMPYIGVPFASAQWTAMTRLNEVSCLSYNSSDSLLLGFIASRQPAIWMGDWGQVSLMPQNGPVDMDYRTRGQRIEAEEYTPYSGYVSAGGVGTWFSALEHSAIFEFSDVRNLVIDASRLSGGRYSDSRPHPGHLEFSPDGLSVSGWNSDLFDGSHSTPKPGFKGYFHMEMSRPFITSFCDNDGEDEVQGYVSFDSGGPLTVRVGLSLISKEQAEENLHREIGRKTLEDVIRFSRRQWKKKFDVLHIEAPDDVRTIFYTALYHSLLYPRKIDEYGRYYSAFDDSIHEGVMYNCWSMWDTYRAEHPLLTLVAPERINDMMQSLVEMYHEGGWLPKWPNPSYTGIMVGSPAETILAEAWTKGFRGFDVGEAYAAVKKNATLPQTGDRDRRWQDRGDFADAPETRAGLGRYMELGYVAGDETDESVSRTQDFGLQDMAAAVLADATGHNDEAGYFRRRSKNYRNLWNAGEGLFLPRSADGSWLLPDSGRHYTECSPETALWCIPYDIDGLVQLMGGADKTEKRLDAYFDSLFFKPERGNRSIHGNEPSHHVAYIYNRIGCPEKTQRRVREILDRCYSTDRKGFDGNEDCGQMSAWYILSSLGIYMLNPADGWYELGAPCIERAELKLPGGRKLTVRTENLADIPTIVKRITFNGRELEDWRISHEELMQGGELLFEYEKPRHIFSMSCKVTSLNRELSTAAGRRKLIKWCRKNNFSKLWLESYRHGETVDSELLREERDAFRAEGFEVCGMITPTCLNPVAEGEKAPIETCWSNSASRERLSEEIRRASRLFDTIIIDDFLFTDHWEECAACSADKAVRGIADWEEYRRVLLLDVCSENIIKPAKEVNPNVQLIIKFPCWWQDWEKRGYSPSEQAELFGKCWVGTETRDANPCPMQSCWIVGYTDKLTDGRCMGGWYDALDCSPERFLLQAYYTILGGAKESLLHCYDYLLAEDPGKTPYGEKSDYAHRCAAAFGRNSGKISRLADLLCGAKALSHEMGKDNISTHTFIKNGRRLTVKVNVETAEISFP